MPALAAQVLVLPAAAISLYVAWSDMRAMRIPNLSVLALVAVFALLGPVGLPLAEWGLRWLQLAAVLAIGFVASSLRLVGAGDAKFAAAMAPFVAPGDLRAFLALFAAVLLAAFVTHRGLGRVPAVRRMTPDWESWQRGREFPMGLALGSALMLYLGAAALTGA